MSLLAELLEAPYDPEAPLSLPEGLGQGRAVYGGYVGALAVTAMARRATPGRPLRSVHLDMLEPLRPGPAELEVEALRAGRHVEHLRASLRQGGRLAALAVGAFGAGRESQLALPSPARPDFEPPAALMAMPYIPGLVPEFTQHLDYRWAAGGLPYSGHERAELGGWCRIAGLRRPMDAAGLIALLDAWPAPVLALASRPVPASTLSWTTYLSGALPRPDQAPDAWWAFEAHSTLSDEGYADMTGTLWDETGHCVARVHQSVTVFG